MMGVSISCNGKDITPGWRSMMHGLLLDEFGTGDPALGSEDIPALEKLRDNQCKGRKEPPFDHSDEIAGAFQTIIDEINARGFAAVKSRF